MTDQLMLHASAVALGPRALLIRGRSGAGKSALALEMMARGALLVSDDQVLLRTTAQGIAPTAPDPIRGLIEARGMGLLQAEVACDALLVAVVDLDQPETDRLPPLRTTKLLDRELPLLHNAAHASFPAALVQYLRGKGRIS